MFSHILIIFGIGLIVSSLWDDNCCCHSNEDSYQEDWDDR